MGQYNVYSLTKEQLKTMVASADDSIRNQIRIKTDGTIFLSAIVGNNSLDGIVGRFETFDADNGYTGEEAAQNQEYMDRLYNAIQDWIAHPKSYVDIW